MLSTLNLKLAFYLNLKNLNFANKGRKEPPPSEMFNVDWYYEQRLNEFDDSMGMQEEKEKEEKKSEEKTEKEKEKKKGCILGVCVSHGVVDGDSFFNFIRDWSDMLKHLLKPDIHPSVIYD